MNYLIKWHNEWNTRSREKLINEYIGLHGKLENAHKRVMLWQYIKKRFNEDLWTPSTREIHELLRKSTL